MDLRPHIIEMERLDGLAAAGIEIELQGAITVRLDPEPLEGVNASKLRMSRAVAAKLHTMIGNALAKPPSMT